jgi:hypothetical protein
MKVIKLVVTEVKQLCVEGDDTERYPLFLEEEVSRRLNHWCMRHEAECSYLVMNGGGIPAPNG